MASGNYNADNVISVLKTNHLDTESIPKEFCNKHFLLLEEFQKLISKMKLMETELEIVKRESFLNRIFSLSTNQSIEKHLELVDQRQNNITETIRLDREINNQRINNLERLTEQNYITLSDKMSQLAQEALNQGKISKVMPKYNEEKTLSDIMGTKFQELKKTADDLTARNIDVLAKQLLNTAIKTSKITMSLYDKKGNNNKRIIESIADLNFEDAKSLKNGFLCVVERLAEKTCKMNGLLGQFINAAGDAIELYRVINNYAIEAQNVLLREEKYKSRANNLMKELIQMTTDETEQSFKKATHVFLARYYATYYRNDVSYKSGKRSFSSIRNYTENFIFQGILSAKIDSQRQLLKKLQIDEKIPCSYYSYRDYLEYIVKKDYLFYVKESKREVFEIKHKLYRAYLKLGEFDVIDKCGDRNELGRSLSCAALTPLYGVGVVMGIGYGMNRLANERKWGKNVPRLKEAMREYLKVATNIDFVIEKKNTLEKLKYYNKLTKSEYGKDILNKNLEELKHKFKNEKSENDFEEAFDLYQKITYTGIADRENYVHLNIDYE